MSIPPSSGSNQMPPSSHSNQQSRPRRLGPQKSITGRLIEAQIPETLSSPSIAPSSAETQKNNARIVKDLTASSNTSQQTDSSKARELTPQETIKGVPSRLLANPITETLLASLPSSPLVKPKSDKSTSKVLSDSPLKSEEFKQIRMIESRIRELIDTLSKETNIRNVNNILIGYASFIDQGLKEFYEILNNCIRSPNFTEQMKQQIASELDPFFESFSSICQWIKIHFSNNEQVKFLLHDLEKIVEAGTQDFNNRKDILEGQKAATNYTLELQKCLYHLQNPYAKIEYFFIRGKKLFQESIDILIDAQGKKYHLDGTPTSGVEDPPKIKATSANYISYASGKRLYFTPKEGIFLNESNEYIDLRNSSILPPPLSKDSQLSPRAQSLFPRMHAWIEKTRTSNHLVLINKATCYAYAMNLLANLKDSSKIKIPQFGVILSKPTDQFKVLHAESSHDPFATIPHFSEGWNPQASQVFVTSEYYGNPVDDKIHIHVDPANVFLGGACLDEGSVLEEIQVMENPLVAERIANRQKLSYYGLRRNQKRETCSIRTRVPAANAPLQAGVELEKHYICDIAAQGTPTPLLIVNSLRMVEYPQSAYGRAISTLSHEQFKQELKPLVAPQLIHFLAMSAPDLRAKLGGANGITYGPWDIRVLKDIYNTLRAGFQLIADQYPEKMTGVVVHSTRFGCGAFRNSELAVYLLHRLVASQMGLNIVLHGYRDVEDHHENFKDKIRKFDETWEVISGLFNGKAITDCIELISSHFKNVTIDHNYAGSLQEAINDLRLRLAKAFSAPLMPNYHALASAPYFSEFAEPSLDNRALPSAPDFTYLAEPSVPAHNELPQALQPSHLSLDLGLTNDTSETTQSNFEQFTHAIQLELEAIDRVIALITKKSDKTNQSILLIILFERIVIELEKLVQVKDSNQLNELQNYVKKITLHLEIITPYINDYLASSSLETSTDVKETEKIQFNSLKERYQQMLISLFPEKRQEQTQVSTLSKVGELITGWFRKSKK